MSILDRTAGTRPNRSRPAVEPPKEANEELKAALAAIDLMKGQLERMDADVKAAHADASAARAEAAAERAKTEALRGQLMEESAACGEAEAAVAAERAVSEGLRGQLATVKDSHAELSDRLKQSIAAAAVKQPIHIPAYEPPAYELEVVGRDVNERARRIVLKPVKVGA